MDKIKEWLKAKAKEALLKEIQKLDKYEAILADQIRVRLDPEEKATQVVDLTQRELTKLVEKAFGWKFLHGWIFGAVKAKLLSEVEKLDNYEDDIAALLRRHIDADAKAKLVVDYVQEFLTSLVNKHIH